MMRVLLTVLGLIVSGIMAWHFYLVSEIEDKVIRHEITEPELEYEIAVNPFTNRLDVWLNIDAGGLDANSPGAALGAALGVMIVGALKPGVEDFLDKAMLDYVHDHLDLYGMLVPYQTDVKITFLEQR